MILAVVFGVLLEGYAWIRMYTFVYIIYIYTNICICVC